MLRDVPGVPGGPRDAEGCSWGSQASQGAGGCMQESHRCLRGPKDAEGCSRSSQGCLRVPGCWGMCGGDAQSPRLRPHSPQRCLRRILQGLQHYRDLLGSDIFTTRPLPWLEAALDQLLGLVQVSGWGGGRWWQPPRSLFPHCSQGSRHLSAAAAASGPLTPLSPQQEHGRLPRHPMAPSEAWAHPLLQRLALQRLQSFATVISRIFTHSASPR